MGHRHVALTFDDGPDPTWTIRVLDALERASLRGTFFVLGERVRRYTPVVQETVARGHSVQPHCWEAHTNHAELTQDQIADDIDRTLDALREAGVHRPTMWRPPFGSVKRPESFKVAAVRELTLMGWTVDPRDYMLESSAEAMLERLRALQAPNRLAALARQLRRGSIPTTLNAGASILLHDGHVGSPRTTSENTVEVIEPLARLLREEGWEFDLFCPERHPAAVLR